MNTHAKRRKRTGPPRKRAAGYDFGLECRRNFMQHPLLIELEALGCNVKDGLYNCMDMEDFYIKMVKKAVAHYSLAPLIDAC
jgi:hypothetical protein